MVSVQLKRAVGTFTSRQSAEQGFKQLYCAGFPLNRISLMSKDSALLEELEAAIKNTHLKYQAPAGKAPCAMITGSILGALGGCLATIGVLSIPGVAPILAISAAVGTTLGATLAGAGIGLVGGGVVSACNCAEGAAEQDSACDEYLVMLEGTEKDFYRAEIILSKLNLSCAEAQQLGSQLQ